MKSKHGSLEGAILTALWDLEKNGFSLNSVKDVYNSMDSTDRAYTTIKTVMDRLCTKGILIREKRGRKFFYRTAYSNHDIVVNSLNEITRNYCSGDFNKLFDILEYMRDSKRTVGV